MARPKPLAVLCQQLTALGALSDADPQDEVAACDALSAAEEVVLVLEGRIQALAGALLLPPARPESSDDLPDGD